MADSLDTISSATGLSRLALTEIWADVKANHARLESCARHDFQLVDPAQPLRSKYACTVCGGTVHRTEFYWYSRGLAHGGGRMAAETDRAWAETVHPGDRVVPKPLWNATERPPSQFPDTVLVHGVRRATSQTGILFCVHTNDGTERWLDAGWFCHGS